MLTFWTFQLREWQDAFWAYRWLFIDGGSSVWDNPLPHRRSTHRAGLRIYALFTQFLTLNIRVDVCFHEVTPPCLADGIILRGVIKTPQTGVMRLAAALSRGSLLNLRPFPRCMVEDVTAEQEHSEQCHGQKAPDCHSFRAIRISTCHHGTSEHFRLAWR